MLWYVSYNSQLKEIKFYIYIWPRPRAQVPLTRLYENEASPFPRTFGPQHYPLSWALLLSLETICLGSRSFKIVVFTILQDIYSFSYPQGEPITQGTKVAETGKEESHTNQPPVKSVCSFQPTSGYFLQDTETLFIKEISSHRNIH